GPTSAREGVGSGHRDPPKRKPLTRLDLAYTPDVERADRRDLRVAPRGLSVDEQDDGLSIAHDLDSAERDAVGDNVVPSLMLDGRSLESRSHAVALRQHLVQPFEEGGDATLSEAVVLRTQHHADLGLPGVLGDPFGPQVAVSDRGRRRQREPI